MSNFTLYYAETLKSRKACAVAKHLESPVEFMRVDLGKGEHKTLQFAAMNPNQKVPVLDIGNWRWDLGQGCVSCSFLGDHFDGANIHLANHDVSLVAVSRGKLEDLTAYKQRLGWKFPLISSYGNDYNFDFGVSFTEEQLKGKVNYNFGEIDGKNALNELPGLSAFFKDEKGDVFHTYSSYARGLDILLGATISST